jgi:hypothetical protein
MKSKTTQISRYLPSSACVAGLMLLTQVTAFACSLGPDVWIPAPDALFSGTVTEIAPVTIQGSSRYRVTFHVIETWKGTHTATKIVETGLGNGDCGHGHRFVLGGDYFIWATGPATNLYTDITMPLVRLSNVPETFSVFPFTFSPEFLESLGQGQKTDQPLLKIAHDQRGSTFSWHTNWSNFQLETSETLQPSSWRTLSNDVHTVGQYYVVTNDVTSSRAFFRLAR